MTPEIEKHLSANGNMRKRQVILNNFLGGLAWGVGTVIGATVVVAILISFSRTFSFIPVIGGLADMIQEAKQESQLQNTKYYNSEP